MKVNLPRVKIIRFSRISFERQNERTPPRSGRGSITHSLAHALTHSLFPIAFGAVSRTFFQTRLVCALQHIPLELCAALGALTPIFGRLFDVTLVLGSTRHLIEVEVAGQLLGPVNGLGFAHGLDLEGLDSGGGAGDFDLVLAHISAFRLRYCKDTERIWFCLPVVCGERLDLVAVSIQSQDGALTLTGVFQKGEEAVGESGLFHFLRTRRIRIHRDEVAAVIGIDVASRNILAGVRLLEESIVFAGDVTRGSVEVLVDRHESAFRWR